MKLRIMIRQMWFKNKRLKYLIINVVEYIVMAKEMDRYNTVIMSITISPLNYLSRKILKSPINVNSKSILKYKIQFIF
jgi:hypothetical protein